MTETFTDFEARALDTIAPSFGADEAAFRTQIATAKVLERDNTKVGFFTSVWVDQTASQPVRFAQQGAQFDVEGVPYGIGVVVWDEDGFLKTIEGFTYDGSPLEGKDLADLVMLRVV